MTRVTVTNQKLLTIGTYNAGHLSELKVHQVKRYIHRYQVDIMCIQDAGSFHKVKLPGYVDYTYLCPTTKKAGICLIRSVL